MLRCECILSILEANRDAGYLTDIVMRVLGSRFVSLAQQERGRSIVICFISPLQEGLPYIFIIIFIVVIDVCIPIFERSSLPNNYNCSNSVQCWPPNWPPNVFILSLHRVIGLIRALVPSLGGHSIPSGYKLPVFCIYSN